MNSYKCNLLLVVKKMVDGKISSELSVLDYYDKAPNETEFLMQCIDYYILIFFDKYSLNFKNFIVSKR